MEHYIFPVAMIIIIITIYVVNYGNRHVLLSQWECRVERSTPHLWESLLQKARDKKLDSVEVIWTFKWEAPRQIRNKDLGLIDLIALYLFIIQHFEEPLNYFDSNGILIQTIIEKSRSGIMEATTLVQLCSIWEEIRKVPEVSTNKDILALLQEQENAILTPAI